MTYSLVKSLAFSLALLPSLAFSAENIPDAERLLEAVRNNDLNTVTHLIETEQCDIDSAVSRDGTALIVAVQKGNESMVMELLKLGASPNAPSKHDGNPLINAALRGNLAIAKILLEAGAEVDGYVFGDETPLICAAQRGHLQMVSYLVENGADVNLEVDTPHGDAPNNRRRPLSVAKDPQVIAYLKANGAR